MDKKVDIIKDSDARNIVVINDMCFKGRRSVDWNIVEDHLKNILVSMRKLQKHQI